jgi:hypothetical protein
MLKDAGYNPDFDEILNYLNGLPNDKFDKICKAVQKADEKQLCPGFLQLVV